MHAKGAFLSDIKRHEKKRSCVDSKNVLTLTLSLLVPVPDLFGESGKTNFKICDYFFTHQFIIW